MPPRSPQSKPVSPPPPVISPPLPPISSIIPTTGPASNSPLSSLTAGNGKGPLRLAYQPLAKAVAAEKVAGFREIVMWVFANAGTDPEEIDKSKIPSRGAVRMLDYAQLSLANYEELLKLYAKVASDKSVTDAAAQADVDENRQMRQLDRILEKYKTNGVQDAQPPGPSCEPS